MPDKAQLIMDAAMQLAEEGGFEAVRLRDVAGRAGVALGTLYARFRSKEDILIAVLDQGAAQLEEQVSAAPLGGPTPNERLKVYFEIVTRQMLSRPHFTRALLRAVSAGTPESAARVARYQGRLNNLIVGAMVGGADRGSAGDAARNDEIAFLLQQVWFAALVGWMSGIRSGEDVVRQMNTAVDIVLRGAGPT